jgi:hypothetical protein
MDQLIELLTQIQDLAGTAIEALQGAMSEGGAPEGGAPSEGAPAEGGPPAEEPPA